MNSPLILNFVTLTIFSLMLAIGIHHSLEQLTSLWRQPRLLLRSLLAAIVLVPLVVGLLLWLFDLPIAVATGLALLAAAPAAPLTYKRTQMAAGDPTFAASLQVNLALLAVIVTPLILGVFYAMFELATERVTIFKVALQVGEVTFLPLAIGLLIQRIAPNMAAAIRKPVRIIGNVLFILLVLLLVVLLVIAPDFRAKLNLGWGPIAAILIMVALALVIGHLLGGPQWRQRSALAVACIARNIGLAVFMAGLSDYGQEIIPTLLAYMILGSLLGVPYSAWIKRRIQQKEA